MTNTNAGSASPKAGDAAGTKRSASPVTKASPPTKRNKQADGEFDDIDADADAEAMIAAAEAAEAKATSTKAATAAAAPSAPPPSTLSSPHDPLALERKTMDPHWFSLLEPAMKTPTFKQLKSFLASEKAARATVYPPENLIHSWSRSCPLDKVKVVIVGQDPYHGPNQAHGMSFSVPKNVPVPGSLKNIYKELSTEYGASFTPPKHGNLEGWASQGVLLLNACLTVRAHQAASHHGKGWEPFTIEILKLIAKRAREARGGKGGGSGASAAVGAAPSAAPPAKNATITSMFSKQKKKSGYEGEPAARDAAAPVSASASTAAPAPSSSPPGGVVFLSWGLPASKTLAAAGITASTPNVLILQSAHPSPLSAHRGFLGNGHFKSANDWLTGAGGWGQDGGVDWARL